MAKSSVLDWFKPNDLMHNPSKFQSMTLGATDRDLRFTVNERRLRKKRALTY